jgi:diguanylate cyclase (GGDEF)-like protein
VDDRAWLKERLRLTPRALFWRWVLALGLLAALSLGDQTLVQDHLLRQQADAQMLNLAGRQRMLALSLSREALALLSQLSSPAQGQARLAQAFATWEENHQALSRGGGKWGLAAPSGEALDLLERQGPSRQAMAQAVNRLPGLLADSSPGPALRDEVAKILSAGDEYVPLMDQLVSLLEEEARGRVQNLRRLELSLAGAYLLLLLAMALFIFIPMGRRLSQDLDLLTTAAQEMHDLSMQDGLTGVGNRRHLDERLAAEWRRAGRNGQPLSLVMLDIDRFKSYNDAHGHQAGDLALVKVAGAAAWAARRAGDLAARYGGEEFVLLLPATPRDGALALAEQLRQQVRALRMPHSASPAGGVVSISLGVATFVPGSGQAPSPSEPTTLMDAADRSLYQAKQAGRDRVGPPREVA